MRLSTILITSEVSIEALKIIERSFMKMLRVEMKEFRVGAYNIIEKSTCEQIAVSWKNDETVKFYLEKEYFLSGDNKKPNFALSTLR
jgi:hypothetical protein